MSLFSILRIDHLVLRVEDLERSIAFYRSALGCEVEKRRDDLGLIHLRAGASLIDLVSVAGPYICDPDGNTIELKGPPDAGESRGR
jgi:glyoxylase I family protein